MIFLEGKLTFIGDTFLGLYDDSIAHYYFLLLLLYWLFGLLASCPISCFTDILERGGSVSSIVKINTWYLLRPLISWTSFYAMTTRSASQPMRPWSTLTFIPLLRNRDVTWALPLLLHRPWVGCQSRPGKYRIVSKSHHMTASSSCRPHFWKIVLTHCSTLFHS